MLLTHLLPAYRSSGNLQKFRAGFADRLVRMMLDPTHLTDAMVRLQESISFHAANNSINARNMFRTLLECLSFERPLEKRRRWLEKCPENEMHLQEIFEGFPEAKVIFNVRDPRAVYASYKKGKVENTAPDAIGRHWRKRVNYLLKYVIDNPNVTKTQVFMIRYEDYVQRPEEVMPRLFNFIGLPPSKKFNFKPTVLGKPWEGNSFDQSTNTRGKLDENKIDAWRETLSADEVAAIEKYAGFEMQLLGYSL
jgi:hypothetical protein